MACSWCAETGTALLSGTTGLQAGDKDALEVAARSVPVLWAPNLSIGINLVQQLVVQMASVLGHEATIEIEDIHHAGKKDAPSGTALMLADAAARARGDHDTDEIVMSSIREGDETGRHQVRFNLPGEQIEITHHAGNRSIYAIGALQASRWLPAQNAGLYTAADFLKSFAG
jgi:4-hydroxy-tetrahydrodipicolinate reductase